MDVAVVDACVADIAETESGPVVVVTSDTQDMTRLGGFLAGSNQARVLAVDRADPLRPSRR